MPLKLVPPREGKSPFWSVRGTHLGVTVDKSTKSPRKTVAAKVLTAIERQIEGGLFATEPPLTFVAAAVAYMEGGGQRRPLGRLIEHFGDTPLSKIDQRAIDAAAIELFPTHSPATRNREVFTPVSAVLKHAGIEKPIRRPKGSRGKVLTGWLWPEQAERLIQEAFTIDPEFGLLCLFLLYTGLRLKEGTERFLTGHLRLTEGFAFIPTTKNGEPRPVYLPPHLVAALANHPRGLARPNERVFRFHKGGRLYDMLEAAAKAAGVVLPEREAFHLFRHTYGTWMRRYAGRDTKGLVATGAWKSEQSATRYAHVVPTEDAMAAVMLPKWIIRGNGTTD